MFFASLFCGCVCAVACGVFLCLAVWLLLSVFSVCVLVGLLMRASARVCLFVFHCLPLRLFVCLLVGQLVVWRVSLFCLFVCLCVFVCLRAFLFCTTTEFLRCLWFAFGLSAPSLAAVCPASTGSQDAYLCGSFARLFASACLFVCRLRAWFA